MMVQDEGNLRVNVGEEEKGKARKCVREKEKDFLSDMCKQTYG
jgi:hypothetical protein